MRAGELAQSDLDRLMGKARNQGGRAGNPKGIDAITLRQVLDLLAGSRTTPSPPTPWPCASPLSRTTARRYLEFLESEDRLDVELNYGQRGRPERRYHWRRES